MLKRSAFFTAYEEQDKACDYELRVAQLQCVRHFVAFRGGVRFRASGVFVDLQGTRKAPFHAIRVTATKVAHQHLLPDRVHPGSPVGTCPDAIPDTLTSLGIQQDEATFVIFSECMVGASGNTAGFSTLVAHNRKIHPFRVDLFDSNPRPQRIDLFEVS